MQPRKLGSEGLMSEGATIVGIRASAGELESFSELLARVAPDIDMTYVFVQHLDPKHANFSVEILSKRARFPVEQAREGVKIFPNHQYVIAPNTTLTLGGGILHLRSRDLVERPHRNKRYSSGQNRQAGSLLRRTRVALFYGMPNSAIRTG
jgi:chemotaxis response regulator CheB